MDDEHTIEMLAGFTAALLAAVEQRTRLPEMSWPEWYAAKHNYPDNPPVADGRKRKSAASKVT